MKKGEKKGSTGTTIRTRSSAIASSASTEQQTTPGLSLRRSTRLGTQSTSTKPITPTSSTRRSERLASAPASDKPGKNANTSSSNFEESKGKASADKMKKHEPKMTDRSYRALCRERLKKEANAGSDDARDDNSSPHVNSESKRLTVGETSLEKAPELPAEVTMDIEKMVLDSSPVVDDSVVISKTSLETDIDLPLKRKRDTVEIVMDACANADDRSKSSDGVITSPSRCTNSNQSERCSTCQKRQRVNDDSENLFVCSCIAQPVQESDHVTQDIMREAGPATSNGENRQNMQQDKSSDLKLSSMYQEYWVPVQLSDVQIEQYCRTLFSKSLSLSSLSKNDLVGALEETFTSVMKTCDHPYVVDKSMKQMLTKNLELHEILDVEIKASGKLHLLDGMLTQIKAKGLKAVVFYQATQSPEGLLLGNILEDFVSQRFGQNSYEHGVCLSKKSAIDNFNKESQCFILLLETRACSQSIKLLRAEAFILFGSSLNPSHDVKLLEKIKIESSSGRTKIFRLYSVCTVEEKALILARQSKPLENLHRSLTHVLLMWGASYLFDKLDHFHGSGTPDSGVPLEQSIKDAVFDEFSSILSSNVGEENEGRLCLLLEANHAQGIYSTDATLFGEEHVKLSEEISPNIFWAKLLGGKNPMWKYYSDTPQRSRKRVRHLQGSEETSKVSNDGNIKKKKKASDDVTVDNNEIKASGKDHVGDLESPKVTTLKSSRGSASCTNDSLNGNDATGLYSMEGHISGIPEDMLAGIDWRQIPRESQRSLYAVLKPEMTKLCLSEDSASMAEKFLEYIIENYRVCKEPATILQAFQLALSWIAASLVKQKCNREESLVRAKSELGFSCSREEEDSASMAEKFLEYIIENHRVCKEPATILQAFQLALSWIAASFVKQKCNREESLVRAKSELGFSCSREEVDYIYSFLYCIKSLFLTEKRGSHYSLVTKDVEKTISDIKRKCSEKLQKLIQTHEDKKVDLMKRNADKKQKLQACKKVEVSYIRVTCSRLSTQSLKDNLQRVEEDFERKNDDLKRETDECLKILEQMHEAAKKKLAEDEACWISRIQNWAQAQFLNCAPMPSSPGGNQPGPAANTQGENIEAAVEPEPAESPKPSSPAGQEPDPATNIQGKEFDTAVEPHLAGSPMPSSPAGQPHTTVAEPDSQVEQSTFANNVAPFVHEVVVDPSAPVPSHLSNAMGQTTIQPVPQIPFPVFSDPFQHELVKLRRESENTKKTYEEKKSVLKAELDRKMAELQAEYQRKFHEVEAEHTAKTTKIVTTTNLTIMNKLLASAFLSKCTSRMASHPSTADTKDRIQQLAQRAAQVNALRNYYTASAPLQAQTSSVSRSSGLRPNSTHCPMPRPRQPLISNTAPSLSASPATATSLAVNARLVSPAPDRNLCRSSSSSIPILATSPTSSAVPQALTYPTALVERQEQQHQHQHQQNLGSGL